MFSRNMRETIGSRVTTVLGGTVAPFVARTTASVQIGRGAFAVPKHRCLLRSRLLRSVRGRALETESATVFCDVSVGSRSIGGANMVPSSLSGTFEGRVQKGRLRNKN